MLVFFSGGNVIRKITTGVIRDRDPTSSDSSFGMSKNSHRLGNRPIERIILFAVVHCASSSHDYR